MQAGHLLLGRPWQFDRQVKHDGFTNTFAFNQRPITLVSLTPQQVYENQVRLKKESDEKEGNEQKRESEQKKKSGRKEMSENVREKEREAKKIVREKNKSTSALANPRDEKHCFIAKKSEIKRVLLSN